MIETRIDIFLDQVDVVLRIGDPQGLLPAAGTLEAAMTTFGEQPDRSPQLDGHAGSALMDAVQHDAADR